MISILKSLVGFFLMVMGGFVIGLNLVTMFPNDTYEASWDKVVFATMLTVFGWFLNNSGTNEEGEE